MNCWCVLSVYYWCFDSSKTIGVLKPKDERCLSMYYWCVEERLRV